MCSRSSSERPFTTDLYGCLLYRGALFVCSIPPVFRFLFFIFTVPLFGLHVQAYLVKGRVSPIQLLLP